MVKKHSNGQRRSSPERTECDVQAAWSLVFMKETVLDADTAKQLLIQREKIERDRKIIVKPNNNNEDDEEEEEDDDDNDEDEDVFHGIQERVGVQLPRFPPADGLARIMKRCSVPFAKELTTSDLNNHLCKLTLTRQKVIDLLIPMMEASDGNLASGIQVITYDWEGKGYPMTFKSWNQDKLYVLTTGWKILRNDHQSTMEVNDFIIVWMFRHRSTKRLCFALDLVKA